MKSNQNKSNARENKMMNMCCCCMCCCKLHMLSCDTPVQNTDFIV